MTLVQIFNVYWQENKRLRRHQSPFNIPRKQCFIVSCDVMYIIMLVHACFLLEKIVSLCLARIIFFLKNSLCYLIIALVCNIFGLGERTFSQWNVFHDPEWPGSSCVQGNSLYTCLYRCDLSFYIHYIISFETVRLNCKGILI